MGKDRYTVTVYAAAPGTPLTVDPKGGTSIPGHMYYATQVNGRERHSYGFAPVEHGSIDGQGHIVPNEVEDAAGVQTSSLRKERVSPRYAYQNHDRSVPFLYRRHRSGSLQNL
jgi:hypothetical protein